MLMQNEVKVLKLSCSRSTPDDLDFGSDFPPGVHAFMKGSDLIINQCFRFSSLSGFAILDSYLAVVSMAMNCAGK